MKNNQYYINSSKEFFEKNFHKRLKFIKEKNFLFSEISKFINNCINNSKEIFLFCAGNSVIANHIESNKVNIKEIDEKLYQHSKDKIFYNNSFDKKDIENCDHIEIASRSKIPIKTKKIVKVYSDYFDALNNLGATYNLYKDYSNAFKSKWFGGIDSWSIIRYLYEKKLYHQRY